jgi:hypothetical protein
MSSEPNTDILEIDPNQYGKTAAANTAFSAIDAMLGSTLTVDASAHTTPYTIPYDSGVDEPIGDKTALRFFLLNVTGALGADWTAYLPTGKQKFFVVSNGTTGGYDVIIMVSGQTGVTIPPGANALCFLNGTDVQLVNLTLNEIYTVTTLPPTPTEGMCASVSDCNTTTFRAIAAGSGTNHCLLRYDGADWLVIG